MLLKTLTKDKNLRECGSRNVECGGVFMIFIPHSNFRIAHLLHRFQYPLPYP